MHTYTVPDRCIVQVVMAVMNEDGEKIGEEARPVETIFTPMGTSLDNLLRKIERERRPIGPEEVRR